MIGDMRIGSSCLLASLSLVLATSMAMATTSPCGDCDGDGLLSASDVEAAVEAIFGDRPVC